MAKTLVFCLLSVAMMSPSDPAMAQTPEPKPTPPTSTQTPSESEETRQRPSSETVATDTELGQTIAIELGKVLGVALSPAVGLAAVGLWYRATSEHPQSYWYASWWFIATMTSLAVLVAAKDTLGSVAGPAKQIADGAEVLLNNGAGLIALAASLSWVVEPLGPASSQLAHSVLEALMPTAHAASEATSASASTDLVSWLGAGMLAALTTIMFSVVWLVSQTCNIMIMLNPFSPIDPFLKFARLCVIGALVMACALSPWIGIPFALLIVLFSILVSGYCLRMMTYGTVMAWDLARGARGETPASAGTLAFAGRALEGVPTRTLGRLSRSETKCLMFRYRPWLVLPARTTELDGETLYAVDGSLYPSLYADPEGRSKSMIDLPPRARATSDALASAFFLKGTGESWLKRQAHSAKSGFSQLKEQMGSAWGVLTR